MFNSRNGYTKIGRSINPKLREKTLQGEEPEIEMIAIWTMDKYYEKQLHQKYSVKRVRGEWFDLSISELIEIKKFMSK